MSRFFRICLVPILGICLFAGCESEPEPAPPPPPPPPRVDLPPRPAPPQPIGDQAIESLVARSVQAVAANLPNAPKVRDTKHRLVLMASDLESERSGISYESERVLRQTLTGLTQDKAVTRLFRIVNAPAADPEKLKKALGGSSPDDQALPDSDEDTGPIVNDPRDVFLLSAIVSKQDRYTEQRYTVVLRVEHPQTQQTVLTNKVNLSFFWDPDALQWREAQ